MKPLAAASWSACLGLAAAACTPLDGTSTPHWQWAPVATGVRASLRGLAAVDAATAWVGGTGGTLLRTVDGGRTWSDVAPDGSGACDFRDLHAFDADTALAMVAGQPARVYRTRDAGRSWQVVVEDARPVAFFDAMAFAGPRGLLFGDPIDGAFVVMVTEDAGATWRPIPAANLPAPAGPEAAFAASGTCVEAGVDGTLRIVTGGAAARLLQARATDAAWTAAPLPLLQGSAAQGAFSIAFVDAQRGVVVGGDYQDPARRDGTAAWTEDGGASWHAGPDGAGGYRSAVVWLEPPQVLATGPLGASLSADAGRTWQPFGEIGFHSVARGRDGSVWACGDGGRAARLEPAAR